MLRPMRRVCGLLCVAALVFAGSASAVLNGSPDNGAHPYVGAFTDGNQLCSGFLVSPTIAVTAGHCFTDGSAIRATFDETITTATAHGVVHVDPSYCCGIDNPQTADVAVVQLDTPQSGPFASLPAAGTVDTLSKKAQLTLVGYGTNEMTNGGGKPQPVLFGERTQAQVTLGNAGSKVSLEFIKLASSASGNKPGACFGDSGGPDLLPNDVAVALTSYGSNQICSGPSYAFRLDTAEARSFLSQYVALP